MVTGTTSREKSLNICPTSTGGRQYENFKEFKARVNQTIDSKDAQIISEATKSQRKTRIRRRNPKRRNTSLQKAKGQSGKDSNVPKRAHSEGSVGFAGGINQQDSTMEGTSSFPNRDVRAPRRPNMDQTPYRIPWGPDMDRDSYGTTIRDAQELLQYYPGWQLRNRTIYEPEVKIKPKEESIPP